MQETNSSHKEYPLETLIRRILSRDDVSVEDRNKVLERLSSEIRERPFKVAIIGQGGVGKTSTIQSVFGVKPSSSNQIRSVEEGTKDIEEKVYEIDEGFTLSISDMPGLKNDITKDANVYIPLYRKILPDCDLIVYIIDSHAKELGVDIKILRDTVIPICKEAGKTKNIVIALNKIDAIGQSFPEYLTNKEYHWNRVENRPTPTLERLIQDRIHDIGIRLIKENIFNDIDVKQCPAYSAVYAYNLQAFLLAILESERGFVFAGTVADKVMAKWSEKRSKSK